MNYVRAEELNVGMFTLEYGRVTNVVTGQGVTLVTFASWYRHLYRSDMLVALEGDQKDVLVQPEESSNG
jgi:hypothetical protein